MSTTKIDAFINKYSLSKTLRFKLLPVGKTEQNFESAKLLEEDTQRAEDYKKVKKIIDEFHKDYIDKSLSNYEALSKLESLSKENLIEYASLYFKYNKAEENKDLMKKYEKSFREEIANILKGKNDNDIYDKLFKKELFADVLKEYVSEDEEKSRLIESFEKWVTYFKGFFENRKNLYVPDEKSTAIPYRCINDNLPKFLDNCRTFDKVKRTLDKSEIDELNDIYYSLFNVNLEDIFNLDYFIFVLSQSGIDKYNQIIGGYTNSDQTEAKVKGLNEIINLYNQKMDRNSRLPKMKVLYKQILSDRESVSFIPEMFQDDDSVLKAIKDCYCELDSHLTNLKSIFEKLNEYNSNGIYIKHMYITDVSKKVSGEWSSFSERWNDEYDSDNFNPDKPPKNLEKYYEKRSTAYKNNDSFSIAKIEALIGNNESKVTKYFSESVISLIDKSRDNYNNAEELLTKKYTDNKKLSKNDNAIERIKTLLDGIKELERIIIQFMGSDNKVEKDTVFYNDIQPVYDSMRDFDRLYDKVRNYITKKPYSNDKIKLNFQNSQFLNGWDRNKEKDYRSVLLRNGDKYYLAIMDKKNNKAFEKYPEEESNGWEKVDYKLLPGPKKMLPKVFFAKSNLDYFAPPDEIINIKNNKTFRTSKKDCDSLIDFYKDSLEKHTEWKNFNFEFKATKDYIDTDEFYNDIRMQGYKISYHKISEKYVFDLVEKGELYLFQIYNKDFSEHSKGTPNLHTLYFKMLFDERNLNNVVYKLNGEAEMFYRFSSLKLNETTVHHANQSIYNKNPGNPKTTSTFDYDIIKDRRYTKPQFMLHIPITLNFRYNGNEKENVKAYTYNVRKQLKDCDDNYVIGIDRGERHLIYISVVNSKGKIVEQYSLNEIINVHNGVEYKTNYHNLLDDKEQKLHEEKKNWKTIEGIKELKEGYISQAVNKICELVVKYDAIIAMEDLNMGFKNSRTKVEKQVYQKFEKMLIDKLNYLVIDKNMNPEKNGGLLNAYQLTEKFTSFKKMGKQNGFILYVPPYLTSKIDPTTGFIDLLKPKYSSVDKTKDMVCNFDFVRYNVKNDYFEFGIDYSKVERGSTSYISKWKVCTNGERICTFRNREKNNSWDNETIVLTEAFKDLFSKYSINYSDASDFRQEILNQSKADFFKEFTKLLALTLQMRNSISKSDIDYMISPVMGKDGKFYCSDDYKGKNAILPENADANGAYNIARKGLWCIEQFKNTENDNLNKVKIAISNKEWLEFAQKG